MSCSSYLNDFYDGTKCPYNCCFVGCTHIYIDYGNARMVYDVLWVASSAQGACISPLEHNNNGKRVNIGISAGSWKQWLYNHRHFFSNPQLRNQTALSKYFWSLKDQRLIPRVEWKIIRQSSTTNSFNGRCNLCIDEKISILNFKDSGLLLNERNKLVFKCRHKGKFRLSWLGAAEASTLGNSRDIDAGFLLELLNLIQ